MKTIAFVIISMGNSDFLEDMLTSLKGKSVILVDNSSEGKCKYISSRYDITYCHELIQGVSKARNAGAALVGDAEYVYFLDDDLTFGESWDQELNSFLDSNDSYDLVGGRVKADYPSQIILPEKYLYLVGYKNLGESKREIVKDYVGGCNLLVKMETFRKLGGFDTHFGHKGESMGLNEDVVFQEQIRKDHGSVFYNPALEFVHHWRGSEEDLLRRIKLQGRFDRQTDLETNKLRFVLRNIKYVLFVAIRRVKKADIDLSDVKYWDYLRYSAYLGEK